MTDKTKRHVFFIHPLTFHPDGHVGAAVVSPWALGGHEAAGRRVEPEPAGAQAAVADRGLAAAQAQVVVERALRLPRNQLQNRFKRCLDLPRYYFWYTLAEIL